ncbi:MAG: hypothetical protein IAF38_00890 [Bacteroidia bacterium]|nr:hypothetical protein [Bacteroidia bacterium]
MKKNRNTASENIYPDTVMYAERPAFLFAARKIKGIKRFFGVIKKLVGYSPKKVSAISY